MTGITGLLGTPGKGDSFDGIDKNAAPATAGAGVPSVLSSLQAHIRALQNENGVANHRIAELETECARARDEVREMQAGADARLSEVVNEKAALEELVASLRAHLARLSAELDAQKAALAELRHMRDTDVRADLATIKENIERLSREVARLNDVAEQGLLARSNARSQRSIRVEALDLAEDVARVSADVRARESRATQTNLPSQMRQGIHATGAPDITLLPPSARAPRVANESEDEREGDVTRSPTPPSRRASSRASQVDALRPTSRQSQVDAFRPAREPAPVEEHATMIYVPAREGPSPAAQRAERELRRKERRDKTRDATANHSGSSNHSRRSEGPASPFPSIRAEDELSFFSERASPRPKSRAEPVTRVPSGGSTRSARVPSGGSAGSARVASGGSTRPASRVPSGSSARSTSAAGATTHPAAWPATTTATGLPTLRAILDSPDVPPATVLARVIAELEADFAHYKSIYVELADQYKVLDAASAVAKRHVLAAHLKEVIDCLEHKADQVAALYSLMSVQDRPASPSAEPRALRSVHELWAGVRDVLGEDAVRRLEADGLFRH
jgi:hypothetical protein